MKRRLLGAFFLALSKVKYHTSTYTPKPITDPDACIEYDFRVVDLWQWHAAQYAPDLDLHGATALEIGPGSDLGIAALLLSKGLGKYYAYDVHDLVKHVQPEFYDALLDRICISEQFTEADRMRVREAVQGYSRTGCGCVNYICKDSIDFAELQENEIDVVFSQAALEHIWDIRALVGQLTPKCKSGAVLVAEVDLKAHSRYIRDHDPLNIYMYADSTYKFFSHKASPNRIRPKEYAAVLEEAGWGDVRILPLEKVESGYLEAISDCIRPRFRDEHLPYLNIMLLARKA